MSQSIIKVIKLSNGLHEVRTHYFLMITNLASTPGAPSYRPLQPAMSSASTFGSVKTKSRAAENVSETMCGLLAAKRHAQLYRENTRRAGDIGDSSLWGKKTGLRASPESASGCP